MLWLPRHLRNALARSAPFEPAARSSAWYRPGDLEGADASALDTIPVRKGSSVPTSQASQAPLLATSQNGKRILTCTSDCVVLPLAAENNATGAWALIMWYRPTTLTGTSAIFTVNTQSGGGSVARVSCHLSAANILFQIFTGDGSTGRRGITTNSPIMLNEWNGLAWVFDGAGAADADKAKIYVNGGLQTLTFAANPTASEMPTEMLDATGNAWLFGTSGGGSPLRGNVGPDIWLFGHAPSPALIAQYLDYDIPTGAPV